MGWFRSDEMTYVSLNFNQDAAHACVHQIGKLGTVQFIDLNTGKAAFQRRFVGQIRRCDELERKLRARAPLLLRARRRRRRRRRRRDAPAAALGRL